jgi:hypothetical protein
MRNNPADMPDMKFFLDTEFIEDGKTIDLISIGLVWDSSASGEYYAISTEFDASKADPWVKDNVLSKLPNRENKPELFKTRAEIAQDIKNIVRFECSLAPEFYQNNLTRHHEWGLERTLGVGINPEKMEAAKQKLQQKSKPIFYGYYADYDWVVFCQLFGKMVDLPEGFPMYCRDIKQIADMLGGVVLPQPAEGVEHDALEDARWNKRVYEYLCTLQRIWQF